MKITLPKNISEGQPEAAHAVEREEQLCVGRKRFKARPVLEAEHEHEGDSMTEESLLTSHNLHNYSEKDEPRSGFRLGVSGTRWTKEEDELLNHLVNIDSENPRKKNWKEIRSMFQKTYPARTESAISNRYLKLFGKKRKISTIHDEYDEYDEYDHNQRAKKKTTETRICDEKLSNANIPNNSGTRDASTSCVLPYMTDTNIKSYGKLQVDLISENNMLKIQNDYLKKQIEEFKQTEKKIIDENYQKNTEKLIKSCENFYVPKNDTTAASSMIDSDFDFDFLDDEKRISGKNSIASSEENWSSTDEEDFNTNEIWNLDGITFKGDTSKILDSLYVTPPICDETPENYASAFTC